MRAFTHAYYVRTARNCVRITRNSFARTHKLRIIIKRVTLIGARTRKKHHLTKLRVSFHPGHHYYTTTPRSVCVCVCVCVCVWLCIVCALCRCSLWWLLKHIFEEKKWYDIDTYLPVDPKIIGFSVRILYIHHTAVMISFGHELNHIHVSHNIL